MPAELYGSLVDCPICARATLFEQPPCTDGHGADCPEWCCVECGTAVTLGLVLEPAPAGSVIEQGRRAA
jgi:hypothetical protein